jgi:Na+/proline symporter/signal transduction histidine kinase
MNIWNIDSVIFFIFLLINIVIGLYSARGVNSLKQYAVGDGNFSTMAIAATLVATWISGSFFIYTLSETYSHGLYYVWTTTIGGSLFFLITAYIFAPRMAEFIGNLSIASAMGNLYGKNVRIITAIVSFIGSGGFIAAQLNVAGMLIEYGFGIPSFYGIFIAGTIIGIYSALGGIKSVTFTDIIQLITFSAIIPILAFVVFQALSSTDLLLNTLKTNKLFDYKEVFDFTKLKSFNYLLLFIYFCFPSFSAQSFQRIAMAKNTKQIKQSFLIAGGVALLISVTFCFIGVLLLSQNNNLNSQELFSYILSNYTYVGLKGLILAGVMAMVMSTADSCINSTAVIFVHDFLTPLRSKFVDNELFDTKIATIFITVLSLAISILGDQNLLKLVLSTKNFYIPMVTVPFVLAVFGFRTSGKAVLFAMFCALGTVIYLKFMNFDSVQVMFIGVLISSSALFFAHYLGKQPGGWVGIKDPSPLLLIKEERRKAKRKFIKDIKNFSFVSFLKKSTSDQEYMYVVLSFFCLIIVYSMVFTIQKHLADSYEVIIKIVYPTMVFAITALLSYPLWPKLMKNSNCIIYVWNFVIFYVLVFGSIFFAIISNFAPIQLVLVTTNLILVSMLIRWQLFCTMLLLGVVIAIQLIKYYLGQEDNMLNLNHIEFKISYFVVLIAAIIVTFLKPKQESSDVLEQKVKERTKELEKALAAKTEFLNNMSHEMHSPVHGFTNISRLLYDNWHNISEEEKIANMKIVADTAERLSSLITNLLDLTKFSQYKMLLEYQQIDFAELVNDIVAEARILYADKKNININLKNNAYDTNIRADDERMQQVLRNVFVNAIKFSPNDSKIEVSLINVALEYNNNKKINGLYFKIQDQGVGIPDIELKEIFEPFTISSFTKTRAGGTGLGLAIVSEIIKAHKAHIWATNNEGQGATFHILIPSNPQQSPDKLISYKVIEKDQNLQINNLLETAIDPSKIK